MSGIRFIGRPALGPEPVGGRATELVAAVVFVAVSAFLFGGVAAMVSDFGGAYAIASPAAQNFAAARAAECRDGAGRQT
jgi:hypothetical protein